MRDTSSAAKHLSKARRSRAAHSTQYLKSTQTFALQQAAHHSKSALPRPLTHVQKSSKSSTKPRNNRWPAPRKNLCAAQNNCFAPKPVPEKEEAPDLKQAARGVDYKQERRRPSRPRPPASLRRSRRRALPRAPRRRRRAERAREGGCVLQRYRLCKSTFYGSFVLNRRVVPTPSTRCCSMAWRCRFKPLRPGRPRCRLPDAWLISTQVTGVRLAGLLPDDRHGRLDDDGHGV